MKRTWSVILFKEENSVEAVPTSWIINDQCHRPPFSKEKSIAAIKRNEVANTSWPLYQIKLFRNSTFDDYLVARSKTKKAESTSDLNSDSELKKINKRKIQKRQFSSSDSESSDSGQLQVVSLPSSPQLQKDSVINQNANNNNVREEDSCSLEKIETSHASKSQVKDLLDPISVCTCCPLHPGIYDLLKEIIRKQNINNQFLKQVSEDLQDLRLKIESGNNGSYSVNGKSVFNICDFPINKEEDVCLLDEYLSDQDNFNIATREVSKLGGNFLCQFMASVCGI